MKQNKQILIILLLLMITTLCGLLLGGAKGSSDISAVTTVEITDFGVGEIQGLVLKNSMGTIALINTPGGIILQEDQAEQYSQDKLKILVYTISHLTARRQINDSAFYMKEFGMDHPLAQVSILLSERIVRLKLGRQNPVTEEYYIAVEGENTFYMIDRDIAKLMLQSISDLRDFSPYPLLSKENISSNTQIKISNSKGSFVLRPIEFNNAGAFWGLVFPVDVMLDWERVDSRILNPLRELCPEKFVSDDVPLAVYGLDLPDITLELTIGDRIYRSGFTQKDSDTWYCADLKGTQVSLVSSQQVAFLQTDFKDLIGNSIYSKSVADVSRISFKYRGQSLILNISGESEGLVGTANGFLLEQKELLDFYGRITSIPGVGILDGTETIISLPLLTISISLRNGGEDILEFYSISQRQCAVCINERFEFYTYTTVVEDIISAVDLLNRESKR